MKNSVLNLGLFCAILAILSCTKTAANQGPLAPGNTDETPSSPSPPVECSTCPQTTQDSIILGATPKGSLLLANNNQFYGMTSAGGSQNKGVLFQCDPLESTSTTKWVFYGETGSNPLGSLIRGSDGLLYGLTQLGGKNGNGVIFHYNLSNSTYTKLYDFNGQHGSNPFGTLLQATNGKLYGLTHTGGEFGGGVIFEYDPSTQIYTVKHQFSEGTGANPEGSLFQASNGKLYGFIKLGGTNSVGALFQLDLSSNLYTKKCDFSSSTLGENPKGSLVEFKKKLYGLSSNKLIQFDLETGSCSGLHTFTLLEGADLKGSLLVANDGKLYGLASSGGTANLGTLFSYEPISAIFSKLFDFSGSNGTKPTGALIEKEGKFYGLTSAGGKNGLGTLFEYDPRLNSYKKHFDFKD